ncbi:hypothetical protein CEXT_328951 [Caerostris extrusa]|uniref:Uncharacterized protein n=1 Tax=Caerostris extrusa TaxID=172846 RepID=A0AAV4QTQ7_CAEEX|nr:hypothetical protein CEXT_328951 [Caerostris extrusa]
MTDRLMRRKDCKSFKNAQYMKFQKSISASDFSEAPTQSSIPGTPDPRRIRKGFSQDFPLPDSAPSDRRDGHERQCWQNCRHR